jgi:hypothetical protein
MSSSLYRSVTQWSCLIRETWEAQKESEKHGPQTARPPSLLPHILLSRHNRDYRWPPKLLQGPSWARPNTRLLENPYILKDPDEDLDPFLLELTDLDPPNQAKGKSAPALSMLFKGASKTEGEPQMMTTMMTMTEATDLQEEEDLPTKSPMATCKIMSPSPQPSKYKLWDPCLESSMETEPRQKPSSPSSSGT